MIRALQRPLQPLASRLALRTVSLSTGDSHDQSKQSSTATPLAISAGVLASIAAGTWLYLKAKRSTVNAESAVGFKSAGQKVAGLPEYRMTEVAKHDSEEKRIWVTYKNGVYDITDLVPKHPGSKAITMASGGSLEPFWKFYAVHMNNHHVHNWLETFRIGNLNPEDVMANDELAEGDDPYLMEPKRNSNLIVNNMKPFNAETPLDILVQHFYTPNEWFYVRNHLPTPDVTAEEYELDVSMKDDVDTVTLSLNDLKTKYERVEVTAAIQCGGNRRAEMYKVKPIKGLMWKGGAIGNAKWAGVRLSDVLKGRDLTKVKHVQFEGYDAGVDGNQYGASIPIHKAVNDDVLLAYEMNGESLPRDHGFPVRVVVPGTVGARCVKWVRKIVLSDEESHSQWQRSDYKGFNPSVNWDNVNFDKSPSIQAMPITSVICKADVNKGNLVVNGYAWAGGGNRVIRVDLTADAGKSWHEAILKQETDVEPKHFGWSVFKAEIPLPQGVKIGSEVEIWSKAVDSNYNSQPESFENIWNLRGLNSNAYHKIKVRV